MERRASVWKRTAFSGLVLLVALGALEGLLRLVGFLPALPLDPDAVSINGYLWISDPFLGFKNRPNGNYVYRDIRTAPTLTTDRAGFRNGHGWDPNASAPEVVIVGDSTVFGAEVNDGDTSASQLSRLLGTEPPVAVLNAGVRGYNTVQAKRMLEQCLARYPTIRVAVYCYCDNDWFENLDPNVYYPAKAVTVRFDEQARQFVEVDVSDPTVAWGDSFLAAAAEKREQRRRRLASKRLDRRLRDKLREFSVVFHLTQTCVSMLKDGRIGAAAAGHDPAPRNYAYPETELGSRAMVHLLRKMRRRCEASNAVLLVTSHSMGDCTAKVAGWARRADASFVPMDPHFPDGMLRYQARLREGGYDPHLGARGTERFARALLPRVKQVLTARQGVSFDE